MLFFWRRTQILKNIILNTKLNNPLLNTCNFEKSCIHHPIYIYLFNVLIYLTHCDATSRLNPSLERAASDEKDQRL